MGTWGEGIFDNDAALDAVDHVLKAATDEIEAFCLSDRCGVEDLEAVMACVAIHLTLHEHCQSSAPDRTRRSIASPTDRERRTSSAGCRRQASTSPRMAARMTVQCAGNASTTSRNGVALRLSRSSACSGVLTQSASRNDGG